MIGRSIVEVPVYRVTGTEEMTQRDWLVVEEPLEIRLDYEAEGSRTCRPVAVTMRTPGHDVELVLGFLFGEGILRGYDDVEAVRHSGAGGAARANRNVVTVRLRPGVAFDAARLERHFYTTSSCGVCGKTSLEALEMAACPALPANEPMIDADVIHGLPAQLEAAQDVFNHTGGLHAVALFGSGGRLLTVREDVGRHNAMDKLVGHFVFEKKAPLHGYVGLLSGRASFELVQKALMAGLPVLAAVGAPSSLAVELAQAHGLTLIGFVREDRFNIYSGEERIQVSGLSFATDLSTDNRPTDNRPTEL